VLVFLLPRKRTSLYDGRISFYAVVADAQRMEGLMNRKIAIFSVFSLLALIVQPACARVVTLDDELLLEPVLVTDTARALHSAFFLRSHGLDDSDFAATSAGRRRHIQHHFSVVLAALMEHTDQSLDVALARLELARGESWSADEHAAWRRTLAQRRLVNMQRLRRYQLRGLFPQNEGHAEHAVPIFVDNHDTACAVGHLMRESGWTDEVAAIQRANNLVYVPDVHAGPLVDWVLISGLTQEEAAFIQPAYYPNILLEKRLDALTQGGSFTENGLTFDNFKFLAGELTAPESFPEVLPPNEADLTRFGAGVRQGSFADGGRPLFTPTFNDWIFLGVHDYGDVAALDRFEETWGILFSFDVTPINPAHRIAGAAIDIPVGWSWNYAHDLLPPHPYQRPGHIDITSRIYPRGASEQAELNISGGPYMVGSGLRVNGRDSESFSPQQGITVVGAIRLEGWSDFGSLFQSFHVVPEPASGFIACLAIGLVIRRRR
jgi:hypothetical protein